MAIKVGDWVRFKDEGRVHSTEPRYFPKKGTVGRILIEGGRLCLVQWPDGATGGDGQWWVETEELEVLDDAED